MCCGKPKASAAEAGISSRSTSKLGHKPCCAECGRRQTSATQVNLIQQPQPIPEIVYRALYSPGQELDAFTRRQLGPYFAADLREIRVHLDARAAESAEAIGALAYSFGNHIVFGPGLYLPQEPTGRRILVHELTHCLQQAAWWNRPGLAPESIFESANFAFEAEAEALALAVAGAGRRSRRQRHSISESPLQIACLGANPDCTQGQREVIHQSIFNANSWVNNALKKLTANPTPQSVVSSLRRNFGSTYGVTVNLQLMIDRVRFAKAVMNRVPIGCNSTHQICVDGNCGFSNAGGMAATICTATLAAGVGAVFQARCVLHECFHAAFSRFTVDHYSSGHGTSTADADYPGTGLDPLLNADSYTTLVMDLS